MTRTTGARLLARALKAEGVETVFTLVGDHILPLCNEMVDEGFRFIDTRHESAAVHMADAWARVTGRLGVVMTTGGPGFVNALPALATAFATESPVLFLSGAPESSLTGFPAPQEVPQVEMASPVTKGAWWVPEARRIPEFLALALRTALSGRPGPVLLCLPLDVQEAEVEEAPSHPVSPSLGGRALGDPRLVEEASRLLLGAERPVAIAGGPVRYQVEAEALRRLIEAYNLPLFTVETARGMVSDQHPLCFGYADPALNGAARLFAQADLVLLLGKRVDSRLAYGRAFPPGVRAVQVDPEPAVLGRHLGVTVGVVGHLGAVVEQLLRAGEGKRPPERREWLRALEEERRAFRERLAGQASDEVPLHPMRVFRDLEPHLPEDAFLVFDGGDFVQWGRCYLRARGPGRWLRLGPLGHLGAGLPFALACKAAFPRDPVLLFIGDGSFGFYALEWDTAVRHNLPIVAVLGNDSAWGIDRQFQVAYYGRTVGTDLRWVPYERVVEALGGHGQAVERGEEVVPAFRRALASGKPALLNVRIRSAASPLAEAMMARRRALLRQ